MATIFTISGAENVLVLEPKESLVYPFQLDSWRELRIGAFMSITTSGFSGFYTGGLGVASEAILNNSNAPTSSFQWGIMTSGKRNPSENGCFFIGNGFVSGVPSSEQISSSSSLSFLGQGTELGSNFNAQDASIAIISSGGRIINYQSYSGDRSSLYFPTNLQSSGNNLSCFFNGIRFRHYPEVNKIEMTSYGDFEGNGATTNITESGLKAKMDAFSHPSSGLLTGYCDSNSLPSALFLFSPFTGIRLRIHSLAIKKYL